MNTQKATRANKILLISNRSFQTGIGNYAFQLVKNFNEMSLVDFDLVNLTTTAEDSYGGFMNVFSQKAKRIIDHVLFLRKISRNYVFYHLLNPNLGLLVSRFRPIVVTVHDVFPFTRIARSDLITQSHGLDIPSFIAMRINMKFVKNADRIISVSEHTKRELTSLFRMNTSKVSVVHLGVDRNVFHPRHKKEARRACNLPLNKKIILHVGVDEPRKNIRTLIEAFYLVRKRIPNTILVRIGGLRKTTQRQILNRGMERSVIHRKKVSHIESFYNAADLLAFPSYYEGFGLPILESMASGVPVVAGKSSSIPEILGAAGIMIPPRDPKTLSDCICQILTEKEIRDKMIEDGLERSLKFSWKTCAKRTLEVYRMINH